MKGRTLIGWLSGYRYRQEIPVDATNCYGNTRDVYLNNQCSSFPHDIRFTANDGVTELKYKMIDIISDYVGIKVLVGNNPNFYIYYGKTG